MKTMPFLTSDLQPLTSAPGGRGSQIARAWVMMRGVMTGALPVQTSSMNGQLRDHPLGELIREISAEGLSGALRLSRERVRAVVYFDAGAVRYARMNLRALGLVELLRRWKIVDEQKLAGLSSAAAMSDAEAGAALVASGAISAEELPKLLARQVSETILPPLLWTDGAWAFDARARLGEELRAEPDVRALLIESARRLPIEFVAARFADDAEKISFASRPTEGLVLSPAEAFVLSRIEPEELSVGDLVAISGLSEADARRAVYALSLGALIRRDHWPRAFTPEQLARARAQKASPVSPTPQPATETKAEPEETEATAEPDARAELFALLTRAAAPNFYQMLGVERGTDADALKSAYYALAKRFHPDRFHHEVKGAVMARAEQAFARIAQAYEVLKDPKRRDDYDRKLGESAPEFGGAGKVRASSAPAAKTTQERGSAETSMPTDRAEESFQQGMAALKAGDHALAVGHLGDAARLAPQQPRYRAFYGQALATDPRARRLAEAELLEAVRLDAGNAAYRVMLAELYRDLGMRRRAEGELQRALGIDPKHTGARQMLASMKG